MRDLILGGARSGKSAHAQQCAMDSGLEVIYIATATADDEEMQARIARHQADRPPGWQLIEEPIHLAEALSKYSSEQHCLLIDCLTLWLSNLLMLNDEQKMQDEIEKFLAQLPRLPGRQIFVSNETGLGVIPMGELSRRYCDEAGLLHQRLAKLCDNVTFVIAGLAQKLK